MKYDIYEKYGIDKSKLKRDYVKYPLRWVAKNKLEKPDYNDFKYLYIDLNLSQSIVAEIFGLKYPRLLSVWSKKMNLRKTQENMTRATSESMMRVYGVSNISSLDYIKDKKNKTCFNNYGVDNPSKSNIIKNRKKQTSFEKYGSEIPQRLEDVKNKARKSCLEKFGVSAFVQTNEYKELYKNKDWLQKKLDKEYKTKKKNQTLGVSIIENDLFELLKQKYPKAIHHYKSETYPFVCDYYIPEIDTYIEYQGYWTHGREPFIGTEKQLQMVKLWESKNIPQYRKALNDWMVRDVLKRNTAKQNNLNWLEFFNKQSFIDWLNNS